MQELTPATVAKLVSAATERGLGRGFESRVRLCVFFSSAAWGKPSFYVGTRVVIAHNPLCVPQQDYYKYGH